MQGTTYNRRRTENKLITLNLNKQTKVPAMIKGKRASIVLCLLLVLFIASDALCAPKSKRGVKVTSKAPPSLSELYKNSYAVIIGINRYEKWPSLEYAVNDAKAMERRLKDLGFETTTLIDYNATKANILKFLGDELPRKVEKNDRVVIFFAGHGQTEELADGTQMGYIIPVDADTRDIFSTAISMDQVRIFSRRIKAKHMLYMIDSCYSGLGLSRAGSIPPSEKDYLRKITTRKAHQMLTAGGKGDQAREEGAHGVFTKYVLEALDGQADRDEKGYITFSDLASYVKPKVARAARNSQTPQYGNIDGEGEFVFVTGKSSSTDATDSYADDSMAAEGKKIESEKQGLAVERKNLEAAKTRLAALKEQQEEKVRIAEEKQRLKKGRESLAADQAAEELKQTKKTTNHAMAKRPSQSTAGETGRDGRFIAYSNGTVLDTQTNLMWAAKDNGKDINWGNAKNYCENYRGGGYTDWRMPTQDEIAGLYNAGKSYKSDCGYDVHLTELIRLTSTAQWTSETRGSDAAFFRFYDGIRFWYPQSGDTRVLPVRSLATKVEQEAERGNPPLVGKSDKESIYASAYELFEKRKYDMARTEFQNYIKAYPNSELSGNAQFWIGECYYYEKSYDKAIQEYEKAIKNYPKDNNISQDHPKKGTLRQAHLKQGLSFLQLGDKASAKLILQNIIRDYPNTSQERAARDMLLEIR